MRLLVSGTLVSRMNPSGFHCVTLLVQRLSESQVTALDGVFLAQRLRFQWCRNTTKEILVDAITTTTQTEIFIVSSCFFSPLSPFVVVTASYDLYHFFFPRLPFGGVLTCSSTPKTFKKKLKEIQREKTSEGGSSFPIPLDSHHVTAC